MAQDKLQQYPEMKVPVPTQIENLDDIEQIACGEENMAAITSNVIKNLKLST